MVYSDGLSGYLIKAFAVLGLFQATQYLQPKISSSLLQQQTFEVHKTENSTPSLADQYRNGCPKHQFDSVRFISRSPEIILIDGFLTKAEADALVRIAYLAQLSAPKLTHV